MSEKELEEWLRSNPAKAYAIYPTLMILGALFLQYTCIQIIDSFVSGRWI